MNVCRMAVGGALLAAIGAAVAADESEWSLLPIAGGGNMTGVEISPSDPNVWYSYADVGGPYRSDDAGKTWRPLHGNFTTAQRAVNADHVRGLQIDPKDPDRIVLVAGWHVEATPAGAYVSSDGGRTFRRTLKARFAGEGSMSKRYGRALVRNPRAPFEILAVSAGDGIFLSRDGGETWTPCGGDGYELTDVFFDRTVSGRVYASAPASRGLRSAHRRGFYRSEDDGRTWRLLEGVDGPQEMAQIPGEKGVIGIFESGFGSAIRQSEDGGRTWTDYGQGLPPAPAEAPVKWYRHSGEFLAIAAGPENLVLCEWDGTVYRRAAADAAWRNVPIESLRQGNPVSEKYLSYNNLVLKSRCSTCFVTVDPHDSSHLLTADWYDLWESHDGGRNWTTCIDTISDVVPFVISCDPHSSENLFYGLADQAPLVSHDGGRSFVDKDCGLCDATAFAWSAKRPGRAYAVGGKGACAILITADAGRSWRRSRYGGLGPSRWIRDGGGIFDVAVDPTTDDVYVCIGGELAKGKGGIYRSQDGGDSWTRFSEGLPPSGGFYRNSEFSGGGCAGWPPQLVFSRDGSAMTCGPETGETYWLDRTQGRWVKLPQTYPGGCCTFVADPFSDGRFLVCGANGILEYADGGRAYRGKLAGSEGLGFALAFDPHCRGLAVSVTKDGEDICLSRDGGAHWNVIPDGMRVPTGPFYRLVVDRQRLFVHTRGSGVWVRDLSRRH